MFGLMIHLISSVTTEQKSYKNYYKFEALQIRVTVLILHSTFYPNYFYLFITYMFILVVVVICFTYSEVYHNALYLSFCIVLVYN